MPANQASALIEARAATFKGREYILDEIDRCLRDPSFPSGYILITGEPGIGKTSLIAYLVSRRNYPYHLNDARQGITSSEAFLSSICDQLADRYAARPGNASSPTYPGSGSAELSDLLAEAARHPTRTGPVVIAVDALDESELARGAANRMLLPQVLPPSVYFVITSRPLADFQLSVDHLRHIAIASDDPRNLEDLRRYVHDQVHGEHSSVYAERIQAWKTTGAAFTDRLVSKSQGNFMYIVHMLESIRLARLPQNALDDIEQLPVGLKAYYQMHMRVMNDRWPEEQRPKRELAIRCLALMREPVSPIMLIELAGRSDFVGADETLIYQIFTEWREFLTVQKWPPSGEQRYSIYHETFQEFLEVYGPGLGQLRSGMHQVQSELINQIARQPIRMSPGHVFISYARDDAARVDEIQQDLEAAGMRVWRDTAELWPGDDWRHKIREAITNGALVVIACFSSKSVARTVSYQNEELSFAIDQLRRRNPDIRWIIPVRFDNCLIPNLDIGNGNTLRSLHRADLFGDSKTRERARLVGAVRSLLK